MTGAQILELARPIGGPAERQTPLTLPVPLVAVTAGIACKQLTHQAFLDSCEEVHKQLAGQDLSGGCPGRMDSGQHHRPVAFRVCVLFVLLSILVLLPIDSLGAAKITFYGAAREVGGSACVIENGKSRVLVDFGLHYGDMDAKNKEVPFDSSGLSAVVLTHGHVDHIGRIPMLYRKGYGGKIYTTDATKSIAAVMLEMSFKIGASTGVDLYGWKDFAKAMESFQTVVYGERIRVADGIELRLQDAGHIMGSSIVEVWVKDGGEELKIVLSGDLGQQDSPLLRDPAIVDLADYAVVESTYGATKRQESGFRQFGEALRDTLARGGSVLIPAFVLEKTQKVVYVIGALKRAGVIPKEVPVYVDSPTAKELNRVYRKYQGYYDSEAVDVLRQAGVPLSFSGLKEVTGKESRWQNRGSQPAIFISSSGMLDHANAPRHLEAMIEDPRNLLAIVGWQAPESLGRRLQDGAKEVDITIEEYVDNKMVTRVVHKPVKMKVKKFGVFSSHADGCEIMEWLSKMTGVRKVFVTHGDEASAVKLSELINGKLGFESVAPTEGETYLLTAKDVARSPRKSGDVCGDMSPEKVDKNADED